MADDGMIVEVEDSSIDESSLISSTDRPGFQAPISSVLTKLRSPLSVSFVHNASHVVVAGEDQMQVVNVESGRSLGLRSHSLSLTWNFKSIESFTHVFQLAFVHATPVWNACAL
jgi:hypothetical protein